MAFCFLDTNAFLKLFLNEKGSGWIRNFIINNQVTISELTLAETTNSLTRLFREGKLTKNDVVNLLTFITAQAATFEIVPLEIQNQLQDLTSLGLGIPTTLRLRTLDALQIIASELAKADILAQNANATFIFISSDIQLLRVAQARGFTTENPENYP